MTEPDMSVDEWAAKHAEGVLLAAQAMENQGTLLRSLTSDVDRLDRSQRLLRIILSVVSVILIIAVGSLGYLVHTAQASRSSQLLVVDCNTPSTPKVTHVCSDRGRTFGFDLSTAITLCVKNLPYPVHTIDVRQCLATSLHVPLDPTLPK